MVRSGEAAPADAKASAEQIARATLTCLRRTVPAAVPGIVVLSGGMSEEDATVALNAMNALGADGGGEAPWALSFSFGRALQQSCLKAWQGKEDNVSAAKKELAVRGKANGLATRGQYKGEAAGGAAAAASSFIADYEY